jgi:hypothetical protein
VPDFPNVRCCVCGQLWNPGDKRVLYRSMDHKWWCADHSACTERADAILIARAGDETTPDQLAAMYRGLNVAWDILFRRIDSLQKDGWRI